MTDVKNERQEVQQRYEELPTEQRIVFKSIIDMIILLLKIS